MSDSESGSGRGQISEEEIILPRYNLRYNELTNA